MKEEGNKSTLIIVAIVVAVVLVGFIAYRSLAGGNKSGVSGGPPASANSQEMSKRMQQHYQGRQGGPSSGQPR